MATSSQIAPHPGQQWAFCSTQAQMFIGGGEKGGGKTRCMNLRQARYAHLPGYTGIVVRKAYPDLTGPGSVWEDSKEVFPCIGGVPNVASLTWRFPEGGMIKYMHFGKNPAETERVHRGKEYTEISIDECIQIPADQWWELFSCNRNPKCPVLPCMGGTTNPDPDWDLAHLVDWYLDSDGYPDREKSGVLRYFVRDEDSDELIWGDTREEVLARLPKSSLLQPISFTYIPFGLADNPTLIEADPTYVAKLANMNRVHRERLLKGNWKVRATAGTFFPRNAAKLVDKAPDNVTKWVRAWDRASTPPSEANRDPDWTAGVLMGITSDGNVVIDHVTRFRGTPHENETRIARCATEDPKIHKMPVRIVLPQDPGSAGKDTVDHYKRKVLSGRSVSSHRISKDKEAMASPLSAKWERGEVLVVRGPWIDAFLSELDTFPDATHDDQVDACSLGYMEIGTPDALSTLKALNSL